MNYKQNFKFDSNSLAEFLKNKKIWFKLHEFEKDVRTVAEAANQVKLEKIVKSLVFIDSKNEPFVVILHSTKKADFKKIKKILNVKDVRLAKPEEILEYSGYPLGAVPPVNYKKIKRIILDSEVQKIEKVFGGGGDVNKLLEIKVEDIIKLNKPIIANVSE